MAMATVRKDAHGPFVVCNGNVIRPFVDRPPTAFGRGDRVRIRYVSGGARCAWIGEAGELWGAVGTSKQIASVLDPGKPWSSPPPTAETPEGFMLRRGRELAEARKEGKLR